MTYDTLLLEESIKSNYLAVLKPRRAVSSFSIYSGSVYSVSFDYGDISSITVDGVSLTEAFSSSLSAGQFYFDYTNQVLYVRTSGSDNPNSHLVVAEYNIYVATYDAHYYLNPLDPNTRVVYYEPFIKKSPSIKASQGSNLFGFMPTQSSSIILSNAEHAFERHLYASSFNNGTIDVYHYLGDEPAQDNMRLVYSGLMNNVEYDSQTITIKTFAEVTLFDTEYRHVSGANFYNNTDFPNCDPNAIGSPVRGIYGYVQNLKPVNVDYEFDAPTTSNNRIFAVCNGTTGLGEITKTIQSGSTTTRTYLNNVSGLAVGDTVMLDGSPSDYYVEILAVNQSPAYIDHAAIPMGMANGDILRRGFVSRIQIIQNDVQYIAIYKRDYDCTLPIANNVSGFTFNASMEVNLGMTTLTPADQICCHVYGRTNDIVINGNPLGTNDTITGNMTKAAQIVADLFKNHLGLLDSKLQEATFTTSLIDAPYTFGFAIPQTSTEGFKSYKAILTDIAKNSLMRISLNESKRWTIKHIKPLNSPDITIEDEEILDGSFSHSFDYSDVISDLFIEYNFREIPDTPDVLAYQVSTASVTSSTAKFIHLVSKSETFTSMLSFQSDAELLGARMLYVRGDRSGDISFKCKNKFFNTNVSDLIQIDRVGQAGFDYDGTTKHSRVAIISETDKNLRTITITANDNKGVEDNAGDW